MRLDRPLVRLPLAVDADRLAAEVATLDDGLWRDHPEGAPGNTAIALLAHDGKLDDDSTVGAMRPTPVLAELPYTRQVLAALDSTIGRTRLMRIEHETELHEHVDINYYWWHHLRVHVPVVTSSDVRFTVGDTSAHMAPGEVWVFDTWSLHRVDNPSSTARIHLVVDTVGSAELWDLVEHPDRDPREITWAPHAPAPLRLETVNWPVVMEPDELDAILGALLDDYATVDHDAAARARGELRAFQRAWRDTYAQFGAAPAGAPLYAALVERATRVLAHYEQGHVLPNGTKFVSAVRQLVLGPAMRPVAPPPVHPMRQRLAGPPRIERPVFVVSPPRSGSTLLFETFARAPELFSIGEESHLVIEGIPELTPEAHDWDSNRLDASDAEDGVVAFLKSSFVARLHDREGKAPVAGPVRMLEKTPKNALRVPFLAATFPDAQFVYLYRDPRETLSSMLDAWRSGRFVTYSALPGWGGSPWSLLLIPGWRDLDGLPLGEVVARQWATTTETLLDDLDQLGPDRWCVASYDRLVADPRAEIGQLCAFLGLAWDDELCDPLPEARHTLDSPHPDKWRRNEAELEPHLAAVEPTAARARDVFGAAPRTAPVRAPQSTAAPVVPAPSEEPPGVPELFGSSHTSSFATLLSVTQSSIAITTYQAGRLILLRHTGEGMNSHFRSLDTPMGIAFDGRRLAIGTRSEVIVFQNQAALAARCDPPELHDSCFVTRTRHATGDLRVHDLAWGDDGLWLVNTRFSCLATVDTEHSFVPRWRPPFVSALAPEDRCHLNGLSVRDGQPAFVTVLGVTDEPNGWRAGKAHGGAVVDVVSGDLVADGLSMPHSPRWHGDRLWFLQSGLGALCCIDPDDGTVQDVARVPGFARGLAFAGDYALIGLSRVREHTFDGLPLTQRRTEDLRCGVWVVDTASGRIAAYLSFDGLVQEIFEVAMLDGLQYPELVEPGAPLGDSAYVLPDAALAEVPDAQRS
jgi:uncharacterized protein (TIGR03032 family)